MDARNYSSFTAYDRTRAASNQWAFPDEIVNQYGANIMGNQFVTPPAGPLLRVDQDNSFFVLNSQYLGSPGYIKYIFGAPLSLKSTYTIAEMAAFEPMNSTMFYPTESNIQFGVSKPSIHNLRVHPFKWEATKQVLMAISLTYNQNNYVRTDDFILPYTLQDGAYVAEGRLALPKAVYTTKWSNITHPNITGFQNLVIDFA